MPACLLEGLVLDLPLYSASKEHLTDKCGHTLYNFDEGNMDCVSSQGINGVPFYGIRLNEVNKPRPAWNIENCIDDKLSFSFYFQADKVNGHGWSWAFSDKDDNYLQQVATSYGGISRFCAIADTKKNQFLFLPTYPTYGAIYFLTVTLDSQTAKLYINGRFSNETAFPFSEEIASIGLRAKGLTYDGSNDSLFAFRQYKLFNRVLTDKEVAVLYAEEAARLSER